MASPPGPANGNATHAPADHLLDQQPVALQINGLPRSRHSTELGQHQATDGTDVLAVEAVPERSLELGQRDATIHSELIAGDFLNGRHLVGVALVLDLPTICSRMSSSVTMPAVPPNSSTTTAR